MVEGNEVDVTNTIERQAPPLMEVFSAFLSEVKGNYLVPFRKPVDDQKE